MKAHIIEVQIFNDATTLYIYCNEDDNNYYFICLENGYPVSRYISIDIFDFKDKKNKNNNYKDCYECAEEYDALFGLRNEN
jgi:hypothetical protein